MATLNVKNMPDDLHEKLRARAAAEHRSVAQQVIHILSQHIEDHEPRSILELRGLGKELWGEIEPTEHVAAERDSWD